MRLANVDFRKYQEQWLGWWDVVNPDWRERGDDGLSRSGDGSWDSMLHAGSNGFVNILAGLIGYWEVAEAEKWMESAQDVAWVLEQVVIAAKAR